MKILKVLGVGFLLLVVIGLFVPDKKAPARPAAPPSVAVPVASISALDLYAEFDTNAIAAEKRYARAPLIVFGHIKRIDKELGRPYVTLATRDPAWMVQCYFPAVLEPQLVNLRPDQFVRIQGRLAGKQLNVQLEDCTLLEAK
ncbi:MAG: hypothetical protein HOO67_06275 [Candidatus Peribacteraceae bacterium]|nr:hypothetical protein [Candidatus Peribacteraceae bacterium]